MPPAQPPSPSKTGDPVSAHDASTVSREDESLGFAASALLTGLSQSAVMIAGGINAALIGARYAAGYDTDGLFTAFAIYSIVVIISTSSRTAMVTHLIDHDDRFRPFNEILMSLVWATPLVGMVFVLIMAPAVGEVIGPEARSIALKALLILWPAAIGQFVVALSAAMLGVLGDYRAAAMAFTIGGALTVAAFVGLEPMIGLMALPTAVLLGTVAMIAIVMVALWRRGWRPVRMSVSPRLAWRWQKTVTMGAAYYICAQGLYLISVAAAGRYVGVGAATLFAYAYFATGMALVMVSVAGSFVLAASIAESWDGDPKKLVPLENDVNRTQLLVASVFTAATALIGVHIAKSVLIGFSERDIETIVNVMLALVPIVIATQWGTVPMLALFAQKQLRAVAILGVSAFFLHVPMAFGMARSGELVAVAIAMSITYLVLAVALIEMVHHRSTVERVAKSTVETALIAVAATFAYLGAGLIADAAGLDKTAADFAAFGFGSCFFAMIVWATLPQFREIIKRIAGSLLGDARRARA